MTAYPVHYNVEHPERFTRLQLAIRVIVFIALGVIGLSFGTIFLFAYLALPVLAAIRLAGNRDANAYVTEDGPRVAGALRWFAAVAAWVGLITDELPRRAPEETVRLEIEPSARPTPSSALWRVIKGIPSAFVLLILGWIGGLVWLWAALSILFTQRVGDAAFGYLVGLQRWSVRLLTYQAALVDEYPPFSFSESPPPSLPEARVSSGR